MDVNMAAAKEAAARLAKLGPNSEVPTPNQLFMAEEQPGEMESWVTEYLDACPELREYIESLRIDEREARFEHPENG